MYNKHIIVHMIVYFCDTQMIRAPESKFRYDQEVEFEDAPAPRRRGGFVAKYDDPQPDIDALLSVVGSKRARDIVRKNRFMSKAAFDEWNKSSTGGRGKYWGDYVDIDEDGMHEFVVRRGGEDGRLVAVNGYTTKASDWAVRKPYYDQYPKIGERPKDGLRGFVKRELFKEEVDEYGYPTEAYAKRIADFHQMYPKYALRVSGNVSPYNLFVRNIASGALTNKINEMEWNDDERKTFMKQMKRVYLR